MDPRDWLWTRTITYRPPGFHRIVVRSLNTRTAPLGAWHIRSPVYYFTICIPWKSCDLLQKRDILVVLGTQWKLGNPCHKSDMPLRCLRLLYLFLHVRQLHQIWRLPLFILLVMLHPGYLSFHIDSCSTIPHNMWWYCHVFFQKHYHF